MSSFSKTFTALTAAVLWLHTNPSAADVVVARETRHLSFTASLSPDAVKAGSRLLLVVDVVPKKGMHVYAPGTKYRAITVTLDSHRFLKSSQLVYPMPSVYAFKPTKEQVAVYSSPFKLTMDLSVSPVTTGTPALKIVGTLSYQACDDRFCYLPENVPLEWTVPVRR